jgi:hypothetical protein
VPRNQRPEGPFRNGPLLTAGPFFVKHKGSRKNQFAILGVPVNQKHPADRPENRLQPGLAKKKVSIPD